MFGGESVENRRGIVANGDYLTVDRSQVVLQLDQLLLAKGSPIRRAEKDQGDWAIFEQ